jgi:replication factor C subunit 3/5
MFFVDKYYNDINYMLYNNIIQKILKFFDSYNNINKNIDTIIKLPYQDFKNIIYNLEYNTYRFSNFQHLIIYSIDDISKEYIVNKLLEKIYKKKFIEVKDTEYIISGYSNIKTKINIKQSKYHIIIEPNSNGFDKYLIQEIIQEYAKSENLNILTYKKLFKIIIINKIDNLSYYAQTSLRCTMEKYSNICKFILISNQLSKIIEPLKSRCLLIQIPLPKENDIIKALLYISYKENINIPLKNLYNIISNSDNLVNHAIWLFEMYYYNINYNNNWTLIIDDIVYIILYTKLNNSKKLYNIIKKIRTKFYLLFITNIPTQLIIRKIMQKLLTYINNINLIYNIINITSTYELRLNQGTRHIIQIEAYILKIIYLLNYNNLSIKLQ